MMSRRYRLPGKEILLSLYHEGLDAISSFEQQHGSLQSLDMTNTFAPPHSDLLVQRAVWGESATKYVFWANYMFNNKFLKTSTEMQQAVRGIFCYIDLQEQSHKAWRITGQQVLDGRLEDTVAKRTRYTNELAQVMERYTRATEQV